MYYGRSGDSGHPALPGACLAHGSRVLGACLARAWRVRVRGKSMHGALLGMATYAQVAELVLQWASIAY